MWIVAGGQFVGVVQAAGSVDQNGLRLEIDSEVVSKYGVSLELQVPMKRRKCSRDSESS